MGSVFPSLRCPVEMPSLSPALRRREPMSYVEHRRISVHDGRLVAEGQDMPAAAIPAEHLVALLLGPGCSITTEAAAMAAKAQTVVLFVGESGVRFYAAGRPFGGTGDVAERHARCWSTDAVSGRQRLFRARWGRDPGGESGAEIRGEEGLLVREMYRRLAETHHVLWTGRKRTNFSGEDSINDALSWGGVSVGAVSAAAVHAVGAIPALGFIHTGGSFSFVYDIADLVRNEIDEVVFTAAEAGDLSARTIRIACRDYFREHETVEYLIGQVLGVIGA